MRGGFQLQAELGQRQVVGQRVISEVAGQPGCVVVVDSVSLPADRGPAGAQLTRFPHDDEAGSGLPVSGCILRGACGGRGGRNDGPDAPQDVPDV